MRRQGTPGQRFGATVNKAAQASNKLIGGKVPGSPQLPGPKPGGIQPGLPKGSGSFNNPGGGGSSGGARRLPGPQPGGIVKRPPGTFGTGQQKSRAPSMNPNPGVPMQRQGSQPRLPLQHTAPASGSNPRRKRK